MNRVSEDKRDPRKHIDTVISREVTSALELRAETTFLLVPLPDHKKREEKKRKRNKYSLKNILLLSPFFPNIQLSTTSKIYYLLKGTSENSNPSWRFIVLQKLFKF